MSRDLGQLKELEESRDQELHAQALQIQQSKRVEAEQRKLEQANQLRSLPLEKLAYEAARKKAAQSMSDVLLRLRSSLTSIETEARKTLEAESEDLKDEKAQQVSAMEDLLQQMEENIASKEKEWAAQNESSSAEALVQAREELAQYMKQYHTKDQKVQDVKTKIADLRTWHVKTKRSINEREKAAQKTAANKKIAAVSGNSGLELLSSSLCGLTSMAACGNVDYSFSVAHVLKRSSPTVLGMEYYRLQKSWVLEKMKASQSNSCSAVVSKKPVQKRLAEILNRSWAECYGKPEEASCLSGMPETMKDYFMVQFGQRLEKTAGIACRPDLNVPTVLVVLEGTLTVGGFLVQELQASTLQEETTWSVL